MFDLARHMFLAAGFLASSITALHAQDMPGSEGNAVEPLQATRGTDAPVRTGILVFGAANSGVLNGTEAGTHVTSRQETTAAVTAAMSFAASGADLARADLTTAAIANVLSTEDLQSGRLTTRQSMEGAALKAAARIDIAEVTRAETQVVAMANLSTHNDLGASRSRIRQTMRDADSIARLTVVQSPGAAPGHSHKATSVAVGNAVNLETTQNASAHALHQRTGSGTSGKGGRVVSLATVAANGAGTLEVSAVALGNTVDLGVFARSASLGGVGSAAALAAEQNNGLVVRARAEAKTRSADRRSVQAVAAGNALVVSR